MATRAAYWVGCQQVRGDSSAVSHNTVFDLASAGCVELWVYPFSTDLVSAPVLLCKGAINTSWLMFIESNKVAIRVRIGASSKTASDPNNIPRNTWTHYAGRWNGTNVQLVKNGAQVATASAAGALDTNAGPLRFGDADTARANTYAGLMYDVRLWSIYRNDAAIAAAMSTQVADDASGLVGNWMFSEGIGLAAAERCAGRNAAVQNSHQWSSNAALPY